MVETSLKDTFAAISLDPKVIESTLKNAKVSAKLKEVVAISGLTTCDKTVGNLLYEVATKVPPTIEDKTKLITEYVVSGKFNKKMQVDEAIKYLKEHGQDGTELDIPAFETFTGVGIVVTDEEIQKFIDDLFEENKEEITAKTHSFQFNNIIYKVNEKYKWADKKSVIDLIGAKKKAVLGDAPKDDGKRKKMNKPENKKEAKEEEKKEPTIKLSSMISRDMHETLNTPELLAKHKEFTKGRVVTRFPPEPNGYLHIGHAKSMRLNFTLAEEYGGICYLRFDDTNPTKENIEFIDHIQDIVQWLGYKPWKVTYSSDYFDQLHDYAVQLIKKGKAFVCHQTREDINTFRAEKKESPFRNRTIEENLTLFENMRKGLCEDSECVLRLKIDMNSDNPVMRDPIAYRVRFVTHPHVGDKWCIYPTYDYAHQIVDSLENITHSCCTLEFESRREIYYWVLNALEIYRPFEWEFSRLNLTHALMSKRKLEKMVASGIVGGWDDPRMLTLAGLRRRGYTPTIIKDFCEDIGVARKGNENFVEFHKLEHFARLELDRDAPRTFCVLDPVELRVVNFEEVKEKVIEAPLFPPKNDRGTKTFNLTSRIYIDAEDFSETHKTGFFGLTPEQGVQLRYGPKIKLLNIFKKTDGSIDYIDVKYIETDQKLKGVIHWVCADYSVDCEVRLYSHLLAVPFPDSENWQTQLNPNSMIIKPNAKLWSLHKDVKEFDRFQFERVGYFVVDKDSTKDKIVFNRIIELKESKEKKGK